MGARDEQDISLPVTVPSVCTEKTDWLEKFLAYTAQKQQPEQPADSTESRILVSPPKAALLSHAGHTFLCNVPLGAAMMG